MNEPTLRAPLYILVLPLSNYNSISLFLVFGNWAREISIMKIIIYYLKIKRATVLFDFRLLLGYFPFNNS